jgi:hypothetical protein
MLGTGNQINYHDSYSGETTEVIPGIRYFQRVGLAIIDPSRPSREIPFVIPARQKGREERRFACNFASEGIYQVNVIVPKDVRWENPNAADTTPVAGPAFDADGIENSARYTVIAGGSDPSSLLSAIALPVDPEYAAELAGAAGPLLGDSIMSWTKIPGSIYGYYSHQRNRGAVGFDTPGTRAKYLRQDTPSCPILWDDTLNSGTISYGGHQALGADPWQPYLVTMPNAAAPTTYSGKKAAVVLEISGWIRPTFRDVISMEKALAGFDL